MRLRILRTAFFLVLASAIVAPAVACIAVRPDPKLAVRGTVLIGIVTGEQFPDWEAALIKDPSWKWPKSGRRIVRVTPTESIHGELLGPIDIETPCYESVPKVGDRAIVVVYSGDDSVWSADVEYEGELRDAASKLRR